MRAYVIDMPCADSLAMHPDSVPNGANGYSIVD